MQKDQPENLSVYRILGRFTILQFMGGLALIGILAAVLVKLF